MSMKNCAKWVLVWLVCVIVTGGAWAQSAGKSAKTETLLVEGSYLEYTITNRVSIIQGTPVSVKDKVSGLELNCETLKVNWSTNNSGIDTAYADGKVVITLTDKDGQHKATGTHAVYDGKTDVITLTGDPVLETKSEAENRMVRMWNADRVVFERAIGKFSALGGKIKGEFVFPKSSITTKPAESK